MGLDFRLVSFSALISQDSSIFYFAVKIKIQFLLLLFAVFLTSYDLERGGGRAVRQREDSSQMGRQHLCARVVARRTYDKD